MPNPKRGEVWRVDLEPVTGSEMGKVRPAVVMQEDHVGRLPARLVTPIAGWGPGYERLIWMEPITPTAENGLTKPSAADALQTRAVSIERFGERLGMLTATLVDEIAARIAICVGAEDEGEEA